MSKFGFGGYALPDASSNLALSCVRGLAWAFVGDAPEQWGRKA